MKTARTRLLITPTLAFLTLLSFASTYSVAGDKKPTLSKKEVNVLLRTAKEPPEHRRIAQYYRQQAERLTNSAKEHQELATFYEKKTSFPAVESKHGTSLGQGGLCRRWAQLEAEQATIAEALARLHEEMAKGAEQK